MTISMRHSRSTRYGRLAPLTEISGAGFLNVSIAPPAGFHHIRGGFWFFEGFTMKIDSVSTSTYYDVLRAAVLVAAIAMISPVCTCRAQPRPTPSPSGTSNPHSRPTAAFSGEPSVARCELIASSGEAV